MNVLRYIHPELNDIWHFLKYITAKTQRPCQKP
jgi:hypothetical protein